MSKPAARLLDLHVCPMITVLVPHVGGPVAGPGDPTTLIAGLPAARVGDFCVCVGPPDVIAMGSFTVLIGGKPAARVGDLTAHGGTILPPGAPTVLIGDAGGGAGSPQAFTMAAARAEGAAFTQMNCASDAALASVKDSPLLVTGDVNKKSFIEVELVDDDGKPVPFVKFQVTPPDGKPRQGFLNVDGFARVDGIDPGQCQVLFPDLDGRSWVPVGGPPGFIRPVERFPLPGIQPATVQLTRVGIPGIKPATVVLTVLGGSPPIPIPNLPGIRATTVTLRVLRRPGIKPETVKFTVLDGPVINPTSVVLKLAASPALEPKSVVLRSATLDAPAVAAAGVALRLNPGAPTVVASTVRMVVRATELPPPGVKLNTITVRPVSKIG